MKTAHEIWTFLKSQYYCDTAVDIVKQLGKTFSHVTFVSTDSITDNLNNFETKWLTLKSYTSTSTSSYLKDLNKLSSHN